MPQNRQSVEELAAKQGVGIVRDFDALLGDFWPEDEDIDEFLAAIRRWRVLMQRLLDTDVVSFLFKRDMRAELYRPHLTGRLPVVSFMTLAELDLWALERNWGEIRRSRMEEYLRQFVVYSYDRDLCRKWAEVCDASRRSGRRIQCVDAWIAATALLNGMPLITHNAGDYVALEDLVIITES